MSNWVDIGQGVEAKVTNNGKKILLRDRGQKTEYPHFTADLDSKGNIVDIHESSSRFGSRFGSQEIVYAAITALKGKGLL